MTDADIVDMALGLLRERGGEGEIYLERSTHTSLKVHDGRIESLVQRGALGAGIRVFDEGRMAFCFTANPDRTGIAGAIETARAIAPYTKRDEANVPPQIASRARPLVNVDPGVRETDVSVKMEIAREAEAAARAESPLIRRTRESTYEDLHKTISIAGTGGGSITHEASRAFAAIDLTATEGDVSQTGSCVGWALGPGGLDPRHVGREAARRAVRKLGARQPATARTTVVLDPEATAGLFGALAGLFSADAVLKGRSLFAGRLGEAVASEFVILVDDGGIAGGCDSSPVDGEGTPTSETVLIGDGVLRGLLHSAFTARKMSVAPTGNGVRGSYAGVPDPSPTNLYLRPTGVTRASRASLLASVSSGVYVTEWMGLHTVNTTTGDFSLGAAGLEIENGRLGAGLDRMAISGNIVELLKAVESVATDLVFLVQGGGATVLLRGISISGAGS